MEKDILEALQEICNKSECNRCPAKRICYEIRSDTPNLWNFEEMKEELEKIQEIPKPEGISGSMRAYGRTV